jgi:hypothetical protein
VKDLESAERVLEERDRRGYTSGVRKNKTTESNLVDKRDWEKILGLD